MKPGDTTCPSCQRVIPLKRWKHAHRSWDLCRETIWCVCGEAIERPISSAVWMNEVKT
jgi:hypothetical protein